MCWENCLLNLNWGFIIYANLTVMTKAAHVPLACFIRLDLTSSLHHQG